MSQFIMILIWLGFVAIVVKREKFRSKVLINEGEQERYKWWFAIVIFLPVIWMAGQRSLEFGDTASYYDKFYKMPSALRMLPSYMIEVSKDKGFYIFSAVLKAIIGANYLWYCMVIAAIQGGLLIYVYRKYSINYVLSVALFVISTDYVAWMFNGVRQFMAVTMIFGATTLMLKKKYIEVIAIILLASTFHRSALLMIPVVFIAQGKAWNRRTLMLIALTVLVVTFVEQFTDFMDAALENTQYANVTEDYITIDDTGTNPLRVLVYSIPAILAFVGRKIIEKSENEQINFCANMSIITASIYVVSMFTSGIYYGRLPIYTSLYSYILLPWEIENFFTKQSRKIVYYALLICYLGFYCFQMHFQWGMI